MTSLLQGVAFTQHRHPASLVHVDSLRQISLAVKQLGVPQDRPVIVVVGGAGRVSDQDLRKIEQLFQAVLAPVAEACGAVVVDGGTDTGVMKLMGRARSLTNSHFPLVGVSPGRLSILPATQATHTEAAPLEPNHTHFVLVKGNHWGDESKSLARVATEIAGKSPSVAIVINGGEITLRDVECSIIEKRPMWVIEGTGRTADRLVAATLGYEDDRLLQIAKSGYIHTWNMNTNGALESLRLALRKELSSPRSR
jgi:hypothetical protein